jgi:hypothetical protein
MTVEVYDQHHFVFFLILTSIFFVPYRAWWVAFHALSFCLGIIQETPGLITYYIWVNQGMIIIYRLNKLLKSFQSESFYSLVKQCGTNLAQIFYFPRCSNKILQIVSLLILSSFPIIRGHSMIIWNQFLNYFDHVRCLNSCWLSTTFVIFKIFTAIQKSCILFKNPCMREIIVTINLFYKLESFGSCFAHLEMKLNVHTLFYHDEFSQRSVWDKIWNTTGHEQQQRSDWTYAGNMMDKSPYTDKLKYVPAWF